MTDFTEIGITLPPSALNNEVVKVKCPSCGPSRKDKGDKSMSVWPQEGTYNCHYCGVKGKVSTMKKYNTPTLNGNKPTTKLKDWFMENRAISGEALLHYGVTMSEEYMPQERKEVPAINFNFFDEKNRLVNIKYRSANKGFKQFQGGKPMLYGINKALEGNHIVITEGEMDCLALFTAGVTNAVSVPNGANKGKNNLEFLEYNWDIIKEKKYIYLALDKDEAGEKLQGELVRRFSSNPNVMLLEYPEGCKDANDVLLKHGPDVLKKCFSSAKPVPVEGITSANELRQAILDLKSGGIPRGDLLGYPDFDKIFSWKNEEMTIITGAPNSGKSAFLDQVMVLLAKNHGWKFGVISMEKPNIELHVAELMQRGLHKNFWNDMSDEEVNAHLDFYDEHFKFLEVDKNELSVDHLISKAEEMVARYGIDCFIVDNWSFVELKMPTYSDNRTNHIGDSLTKFKLFKEKFKCGVMIVAHTRKLSKDSKGNVDVAGMYDIAESAHFANKADNIIVVYRNFETGLVDVYTKKVRWSYTGTQGVAHFTYDVPTGCYAQAQTEMSLSSLDDIIQKQRERFKNQPEDENEKRW